MENVERRWKKKFKNPIPSFRIVHPAGVVLTDVRPRQTRCGEASEDGVAPRRTTYTRKRLSRNAVLSAGRARVYKTHPVYFYYIKRTKKKKKPSAYR